MYVWVSVCLLLLKVWYIGFHIQIRSSKMRGKPPYFGSYGHNLDPSDIRHKMWHFRITMDWSFIHPASPWETWAATLWWSRPQWPAQCAGRGSETFWHQSWKKGTIRRFLGSFDSLHDIPSMIPLVSSHEKSFQEPTSHTWLKALLDKRWHHNSARHHPAGRNINHLNLVADWRFHPLWDSTEKKVQCTVIIYTFISCGYIYIHIFLFTEKNALHSFPFHLSGPNRLLLCETTCQFVFVKTI